MRKSFASFVAGTVLAASALLLTGMAYGPAHQAVADTAITARLKPATPVNVLVQNLNGSPVSPASITTATGADADSAAVAAGSCLMVQCSTDTYVLEGTTVAASGATRGYKLLADEKWFFCLQDSATQFSTLAVSSAGSCGYWLMK